MKVKLIRYTPNGEKLMASAGKLCYSKVAVDKIEEDITDKTVNRMINMFKEVGHGSMMEHLLFTFSIEGMSRVTETQLVRHRHASYSIQSSRYNDREDFDYVLPDDMRDRADEIGILMQQLNSLYARLVDAGVEKDHARYILPQGMKTNAVVSMNARSLLHFFSLRTCNRASKEIHELADKMLTEVKEVYPTLFKDVGPACMYGPCPEGKMSCGKIEEVRKKYNG